MLRNCFFALLTGPLVTAAWCGPLEEFQTIVKQCTAAYTARPATEVIPGAKGNWVKSIYTPPALSYDVKKTDSLVSPFVAWINITDISSSEIAADEATASALPLSLDTAYRTQLKINFSYQNNQWVLGTTRDMYSKRNQRTTLYDHVVTVDIPPERFLQRQLPLRACAP